MAEFLQNIFGPDPSSRILDLNNEINNNNAKINLYIEEQDEVKRNSKMSKEDKVKKIASLGAKITDLQKEIVYKRKQIQNAHIQLEKNNIKEQEEKKDELDEEKTIAVSQRAAKTAKKYARATMYARLAKNKRNTQRTNHMRNNMRYRGGKKRKSRGKK